MARDFGEWFNEQFIEPSERLPGYEANFGDMLDGPMRDLFNDATDHSSRWDDMDAGEKAGAFELFVTAFAEPRSGVGDMQDDFLAMMDMDYADEAEFWAAWREWYGTQ